MLTSYCTLHSLRLLLVLTSALEGKRPSAAGSILCDEGPYLIQKSLSSFQTLPGAHLLCDSSTFLKHYLVTNSLSFVSCRYTFNWQGSRVMKGNSRSYKDFLKEIFYLPSRCRVRITLKARCVDFSIPY